MPRPVNETCAGCKFMHAPDSTCRRYPPEVVGLGLGSPSQWPVVKPTDWCGEFKVAPKQGEG